MATRVARPVPAMAMRFYSEKKDDAKKQQAPKSLLTDDVLEKAGMEVPKDQQANKASASETEGQTSAEAVKDGAESANETQPSEEEFAGASEEQKQRWKGTAKKSTYKSSTDIKREKRSNLFYVGMLGAVVGGALYLGRDWDDEKEQERHKDVPNGYDPASIYGRMKARFNDVFFQFNEPVFEKLLHDPLPEPYGRPLTLVLGLEDLLVHSEWTREHGWRTAKRPGLDYFLGYLSQYYEIVIFSSAYMSYSEKVVEKLDPYRATITQALFREATRYQDGKIIKDMSNLNRDLSKVILVDTNPDAWSLQPDNAVAMDPWLGDAKDKDLVRLIPFLEWVATQPVKDVRPILKSFQGTNVPAEYAKREAIARAQFEKEWREQQKGGDWAASFLGIKPQTPPTPKMPQDYIREQGQKGYEEFRKYIQEHGAKLLEEEKQREKEIVNEHQFTLNKVVTKGMPNAEEIAALQAQKEKDKQSASNSQ